MERLLDTTHFLLFVLPHSDVHMDTAAIKKIQDIERMLLDRRSTAAVAFARETADISVLLDRLQSDGEEKHRTVQSMPHGLQEPLRCRGP